MKSHKTHNLLNSLQLRSAYYVLIPVILALFTGISRSSGATASQLSQFGITWKFSREVEFGQFVNGDFWVIGPITVTDITKPNGPGRDGSMINPRAGKSHGFDSRVPDYKESLDVSCLLPNLIIYPNSSLISTISRCPTVIPRNACRPRLDVGAVLTVLDTPPPANSFRPPYAGDWKPIYSVTNINMDILPALPSPVADIQSVVDSLIDKMEKPWLDRRTEWNGDELHPAQNMPNYGGDMAQVLSSVSLLLLSDISQVDKVFLVIKFTQIGIDFCGNVRSGAVYGTVGGGIGVGRKWPILFAGLMLDDVKMKNIGFDYGPKIFQEDCQTHYLASEFIEFYPGITSLGTPLWGERHCIKAEISWVAEPGNTGYQDCCTANRWNGSALAAMIMNAKPLWNHDAFFDYTDRHMEHIIHDQAWFRSISDYQAAMWDAYRANYGPVWSPDTQNDKEPPLPPVNLTSPSQTDHTVKLSWDAPAAATDGDFAYNYSVFRNNVFVNLATSTSYTDVDLLTQTSYDYKVYSNDDAGNQSETALIGSFVTLTDTTAPNLATLQAQLNRITIIFDERLDFVSAQTLTNYAIPGLGLTSATLAADQKTIQLETEPHQENVDYTLTLSNIEDLSGNTMALANIVYQYLSYSLSFSLTPDRADPSPLFGAAVIGDIYVFLTPETNIQQVRFYLDDPDQAGATFQIENSAPFDFAGGTLEEPVPFDTATITNGTHSITVSFDTATAGTQIIQMPFTVTNSE
jgi:chitodextrinase